VHFQFFIVITLHCLLLPWFQPFQLSILYCYYM